MDKPNPLTLDGLGPNGRNGMRMPFASSSALQLEILIMKLFGRIGRKRGDACEIKMSALIATLPGVRQMRNETEPLDEICGATLAHRGYAYEFLDKTFGSVGLASVLS